MTNHVFNISAVQECKDVLSELQKIEKRSKFRERTEESSATQYFQVLAIKYHSFFF